MKPRVVRSISSCLALLGLALLSPAWAAAEKQPHESNGLAPTDLIERVLDIGHVERGRLIYDGAPKGWLAGACLTND